MSDRDSLTTASSISVYQEHDLMLNDHDDEKDEIIFFGDHSESSEIATPPPSSDYQHSNKVEEDDEDGDEDLFDSGDVDDDIDSVNVTAISDREVSDNFAHPGNHVYTFGFAFDYDHMPSSGYTKTELAQAVQVVKSSKDAATGKFLRETRNVSWCLSNGCEEFASGVWSKEWYFTYKYGEASGQRAWRNAVNRRLVKQRDGKAFKLANDKFCEMLQIRSKGNRAFSRGQYKSALDCYLKAENIMGGAVSGMYLVPHQRAELVKILSNQSEVYLRMGKYHNSILQSSAALQLDKRHAKSLLRRAKAIVYGAEQYMVLDDVVAAQASDDLRVIVNMKGEGASEAQAFLDELSRKVQRVAGAP